MAHIFAGLFMAAVGIWGIFEEYYYVADFIKGGGPLFLMAGGVLATLAGCVAKKKQEEEHE